MSRPVLAALTALAVTIAALALLGGAGPAERPPVVSNEDRDAIAAIPVERGADPPQADPDVDMSDPEAVGRAFLAAAHTVEAADRGRTHLRGAPYAEPGSAAGTVGTVVLDPPPPGTQRTATVTAMRLVASDPDGLCRGYRAELGTATGPPGGPYAFTTAARHVVLVRQPDGRWLVAVDSAATTDLPAGEG
ncbi:hypothetical protein [Pseudonocardia sp. TRM90224]|uniref:hypothetical protein n=1 Tax=Pseudonocardia sp. TRM90224 TaxID=2812678 RepID=UPI001E2E78F2|nr:hypothetical protein [Pseudonocardia sp. TRM90224]